jgi:putative ABC transport system substrate-binding protein
MEVRFASGRVERLPELAAELVRLKPDVIVTPATPPSLSAKQATRTIPIVFAGIADPVGAGLITNFARPGGNITGVASIGAELGGKRLELLKEVAPKRPAWPSSIIRPTERMCWYSSSCRSRPRHWP